MPDQSKSTGDVEYAGRIEADLEAARAQAVRGHQVVAKRTGPGLVDPQLFEGFATYGPGAAPDPMSSVAAQHGHHVAVDRAYEVVGHGRPLGDEPAVAGGRPDLRPVVLVDRGTHPERLRAAVGIEERQVADIGRQVGRGRAEIMDLLAARLGTTRDQQPRWGLRAGGHRLADGRASRIGGVLDNERYFIIRVVLGQEGS